MLIGLTGQARSGKDTIADWLVEHHNFTKISFAMPIKNMVCSLLGMNASVLEELKDHNLDFLGVTPRRLLQTLGTEWGREIIDPNIWIIFAEERINILRAIGKKDIVISDVRFENEAHMIHRLGGQIYQTNRNEHPAVESHISELGISNNQINGCIYNSGSREELYVILPDFINTIQVD